jgi:hypothetical protein
MLGKYLDKQSCKMHVVFPQFTTNDIEEDSHDDKIKKRSMTEMMQSFNTHNTHT